jgi:hypothetical protein
MLRIYIDDLVITGACTAAIALFKQDMSDHSQMNDLGLLSIYLEIKVVE